MLGLRHSPLSKRTSRSSSPMPTSNETPPAMTSPVLDSNGAANGHSNGNNPQSTLDKLIATSPISSPSPIIVTKARNGARVHSSTDLTDAKSNISRIETHTALSSRSHNGTTNTTDNGTIRFGSDRQVLILRETVTNTRNRFIRDFEHVNEHQINSVTIDSFLEYIESERLTHMPHHGSRWDKVLKWAEFYAVQIASFQKVVSPFVQDSRGAVRLIWIACRLLLELGPENAQALETTFGVFYNLGLSLSLFLRHAKLLSCNSQIRMEVGQAFNDMLLLVNDVAIHYRGVTSGSQVEIYFDFNTKFGRHMEAFYRRKNHITDAMWEYQLDDNVSIDIRTIRKWLSTRDSTIQSILNDRLSARGQRDEYTCDWFQRHLLDFSRGKDDVFAITGPSGCGKSILAGWITERLQRPLGRKTHTTLSYMIGADIPSESTTLAIVKNLSLQLLETDVGDIRLFQALANAHDLSLNSKDTKTIEEALWSALDMGLDVAQKSDHLIIVVDGLDEVSGDASTFNAVSQKLGDLAKKHAGVQAIILSGSALQLSKVKTEKLEITADHTHKDIHHVAGHVLQGCAHFDHQPEAKREAMIEQLTHAAKGNFLWLILSARILRKETTHENFIKALDSLKNISSFDIISQLVKSVDFTKSDTKLLLSWLLVAERPLHVREVQSLLDVDIHKIKLLGRNSDIQDHIVQSCSSLVVIRNGIIFFRHDTIRAHLMVMQKQGKELLEAKAAQADLTMRMLAYCKLILTKTYEPAFAAIDMVDVDDLFHQHSLLEYSVRNWVWHFQNSSMHKAGALKLSSEFKALFPNSVHLALIEWACWEPQTSTYEAITIHEVALNIREAVFTEKHNSVLQTMIVCGTMHRKVSQTNEAARWFYKASRVGQSILNKYSTITISCTTTFLEIAEAVRSTTRTEMVTWKEEMLKYTIEGCKHKHGKTSNILIRYYNILAELYVEIDEDNHAEETWRELREIVILRHGKGSEEEVKISGQLNIILRKSDHHHGEIREYEEELFKTTVEMEVWDVRRIEITITLAETYEARGELFKAEELYIMLWRHLRKSHHDHRHLGVDIHISMIDIALKYVYFLRRCHRHEEACGILICLWNEYEEYEFDSETIILRLKVVAELMRAVSLLSIAVSVLRKCLAWFEVHGKQEHCASVEVLISETIEKIITSTTQSTTVTASTTTTTTTESIIKEVFESIVSKTTLTNETISVCRSLISYYMKLEHWSEAITTAEKSLTLMWKVIVSGKGTMALPREFSSEAIEISIRLAICHRRAHRYHESEKIYIRIYRACWNSCSINDERLTSACDILIKFYEENHHWHKMIEIYQEMLVGYRRHLGGSHALTIRTLYILGSLCAEHGHGHPHEYYEEIVAVLNGKGKVCHLDAKEAMILLCRDYYQSGQWEKLKTVCEILWNTWTHHHREHKFEASFIELLYMRYMYVLEHHDRCEYEVLRSLTITYRDTCVAVFGASVTITIKASMELAQICMRSEKHVQEAISYYEEIIKTTTTKTTTTTTTTVISTTTITTIKDRLTKAYIHVCSKGSTSTETVERAIKVINERFEYLRSTFGCSHSETLMVLRELVVLYIRLKNVKMVQQLLRNTTVEIITKEKHSKLLFEAAKTIASIYLTCGVAEFGQAIIHEMRRQIITKVFIGAENWGFKIDTKVGKSCYVFIVTFEALLNGEATMSYSDIMAELLLETILYESYTRSLTSGTGIESTMRSSARYWAYLLKHSRTEELKLVEDHVFAIFMNKWGKSIKSRREITLVFHRGLLEELGDESDTVNIGKTACAAGSHQIRILLEQGKYQEAYDVASCAFQFIKHERAYHDILNIGHGFKLSGYMAGRGLENKNVGKAIEPALYGEMVKLSQAIIRDVLDACRESKINFARLKLGELNDLVGLLGAQRNFSDLEWLFESLWSSREVQKKWTPETIVAIGKRYVQARLLGNHGPAAILLCEDICYNLRRVWGDLDPKVLDMSEILSQVYTNANHYADAMGVHEEILRLVVEGDDDDDRTIDTMTSARARRHLDLLKRSYQRLGKWDKSPQVYKELVDQLLSMPVYKTDANFKGVQSTDKWNVKEELSPAVKALGTFAPPEEWEFVDKNALAENGDLIEMRTTGSGNGLACGQAVLSKRHGFGVKRATSNWGLQFIQKYLHGDEAHD